MSGFSNDAQMELFLGSYDAHTSRTIHIISMERLSLPAARRHLLSCDPELVLDMCRQHPDGWPDPELMDAVGARYLHLQMQVPDHDSAGFRDLAEPAFSLSGGSIAVFVSQDMHVQPVMDSFRKLFEELETASGRLVLRSGDPA
jgi:hypothetical protein